jgi:hypothetical protein
MRKAISFLAPNLIVAAAVALGCNLARAQDCPGNPDAQTFTVLIISKCRWLRDQLRSRLFRKGGRHDPGGPRRESPLTKTPGFFVTGFSSRTDAASTICPQFLWFGGNFRAGCATALMAGSPGP